MDRVELEGDQSYRHSSITRLVRHPSVLDYRRWGMLHRLIEQVCPLYIDTTTCMNGLVMMTRESIRTYTWPQSSSCWGQNTRTNRFQLN